MWWIGVCRLLAVLAYIVILAVIGLGFYELKSRAGWLRIQAGIWRLITFSIEIGRRNPALSGEPRELEPGRDEPSGAVGQDNGVTMSRTEQPGPSLCAARNASLALALCWRQPGSSHAAVSAPCEDERPHWPGGAVPSSVCQRKAQ